MKEKKIVLLIMILLLLTGCGGKKIHKDARKYQNGKCVVYYPNNETIRDYAMDLCESKEEATHDFEIKELGDFFSITYDTGKSFYVTEKYKDPELSIINKDIVSDQLRYAMKADGLDIAYTSQFILDTAADSLPIDEYSLTVEDGNLRIYVPQYDYTLKIPLCYAFAVTGKDFGIMTQTYHKHRFIDPQRPMIALTFDDGPYSTVDSVIYDLMEKYDARCTFFFVGDRFSEKEIENTRRGIALGLEYGSHTMSHEHLGDYSDAEAKKRVTKVADELYAQTGYQMKIYRPPYGERNTSMEQSIGMTAILWNVDSRDWSNRDADTTYRNVMDDSTPNDIILMHSLYTSTADACKRIVPELIDQGYQLVTVSELMQYLGIEGSVFGGR
ncbi:MAG: polysaccharide deacetylase family protein [Erysipelotrichaceae bacterium]|nr:polysaccharide deacetylase family protein [Erysipelotrichaceae bacterium]